MANEVDYIPCKYRGNGLTSHFSFRWKIFTEKDIIVQLEDVVSGKQVIQQYATDYSVSFNDVGGFVSFENPPAEDSYIVISRNVSDYQSKTYSTSTGFQGSELEDSFDEVSCNIQELEYDLKRAIKVPVGSSVLNLDLPLPQAGKTLKWNKEENGLVNSTINVDTLENIANRLYESVDNVDLVAENTENIKAVNENKANINTVANSIGNVNSVGTNIEAVKSVNANEANINAVNNNKENINTVVSNLPLIEKAPINAQNAQIWAEGSDEQVQAIGGTHSAKTWNKIIDKNSYADKSLSNLNAEGLSKFGLKEGRDYIKLQDTDVDVPTASTIAGLTFVEID